MAGSNYVAYNLAQARSDSEKLQARNNIGAAGLSSLAASFDSRAPSYNWSAGEVCTYGGKLWMFDANHSGAWTGADAHELTIADVIKNIGFSYVDVTADFDTSYAKTGLVVNELLILYSPILRLIYISLMASFAESIQIINVQPTINIAMNTNPSSLLYNKEFSRIAYGKHTESSTGIEFSGDTVRIYNNYLTFTPTKSYPDPDRAIVKDLFARVLGFEIS